jgi:3-phenylpropionate/cinnamic acid dioxygenase small subunit
MADDIAAARVSEASGRNDGELRALLLQHKVEQYYYHEAMLLDERRYNEWLALFTPDTYYFMPVRRTRTSNDLDKEFTQPGQVAFFDDDLQMLGARVKKLASGYAWAEDPPSRQRHLVTNVRILADDGNELTVENSFHFYRARLNSEEDNWLGHRKDTLRRDDGSFKIARREIYLEQTVLLARNLSNFF